MGWAIKPRFSGFLAGRGSSRQAKGVQKRNISETYPGFWPIEGSEAGGGRVSSGIPFWKRPMSELEDQQDTQYLYSPSIALQRFDTQVFVMR